MTPRDIDAALSALAALGLWPPWRQSAAERQAGNPPDTTREATRQAWRYAAELAYVTPAALLVACQSYAGERWPSPADAIALVVRARPAAAVGACIRSPPESCSYDGLVSVAVHYTDAAGLPMVWVGATWCDCDRGQAGAGRQAQPSERGGAERPRGLTVAEHRARYAATGRLVEYVVGPAPWQTYPKGHAKAQPPSAATLARAAELAKIGTVPIYDAPAMRDWTQATDADRW
jgi:hypothetical protein